MTTLNSRLGLWTAPAKIKPAYKWLIFLFLLFAYLATGRWMLAQWGELSRVFVFLFTLPAAFFWGFRGAVIVALATPILVLMIHKAAGIEYVGGPIGPAFLFLITTILGRMCDLSLRLEEAFRRKERAEQDLHQYHIHLEETVQKRAAELSEANIVFRKEIEVRKKVEEALRESEEKYRNLIENANDAIYIAQDGLIKFSNPAAEKLTGYPAEDLFSIPITDLVHPDHREMVIDRHRRRLAGETLPSTYSFQLLNRQGKALWVQLNVVAFQWEGRPATLNFIRDITAQRRLEEQLLQAQKFEALGTLAGGVAHDFNNLLMAIQGRVSLLAQENYLRDPTREHINAMEEYIRSAAGLTKQLLGLARGGKYAVRPLDVNELVRNSVSLFARTRKEIEVRTRLGRGALVVEADLGQIEQVLLNLYLNAWQAMPRGGEMVITTSAEDLDESFCRSGGVETGCYVKITIADTGIGMDPKTQQRIFDPFFTTKGKGRGTGLGLASAYGIIKNHGGMITVSSEVGRGTVFDIYLPMSEKNVCPGKAEKDAAIRGSETILLVDDEAMIIEVGQAMLESLGYDVIAVADGDAAVQAVSDRGERIDLVILDLVMPGLDGGQVFDNIREIQPQIPVILSSGYAADGYAEAILKRGCNGFIQKPFSLSELSVQVRMVLDAVHPV